MRTLGRPNESDELRRLTQRVFNLERARGEARVARSGDKMTGRLYGPTGLDPISTDEYARKAYVDAQANTRMLVDAKGDLLVGTGPDQLARLPVGPSRRVLIADDSATTGLRWDWLKVGGPTANRIELHDHADPGDTDTDDGIIHFLSPEPEAPSSGGRLYQGTRGVGGARQTEMVFFPSGLGRDYPQLTMLSGSVDGTIKASVELYAEVAIKGPVAAPTAGNDLVNKAYVDGAATTGNVPVGGMILWTAATQLPSSYLYCQGQAVSRTTYAALFAVIGTTYGAGDGSTTFNVPNLTDRIPQGVGGLGLGGTADKGSHFHNTQSVALGSHFHNTQTSTDLNTGSGGASHDHFFGTGVNTFDQLSQHTHDYSSGTAGVAGTAGEQQLHRHSLQGIITSAATASHSHNVGTHNHGSTLNTDVGSHNHGSTLTGGVSLTALGLYFAIRAS